MRKLSSVRRALAMSAVLLSGCQALLVFDENATNVVVVNEGDAATVEHDGSVADASPAEASSADASNGDAGPRDPCALPPPGTVLLYCDGFESDAGPVRSGGAWTLLVDGTATPDTSESVPRPGTSLHLTTKAEGQIASFGDQVDVTKPTELHLELDAFVHSHARGCAIAQFQFGTYFVRVIVESTEELGIDEYVQGAADDFGRTFGGVYAVPRRWVHLELDVSTDAKAILHANLSVDGVERVSHDLMPSSSATAPLVFQFGTVDGAATDMHIDNVRVTRSPR